MSRSGASPEPTVESGWEKVVDVECDTGWFSGRMNGTALKAQGLWGFLLGPLESRIEGVRKRTTREEPIEA